MNLTQALRRLFVFITVSALGGVAGCGDSGGQVPRPVEGVSVVYEVQFPRGVDPANALRQTIDALRARCRSNGSNWHIASPGWDQIEIVAPCPYEDKKETDRTVAAIRRVVESGTLSFHIAADPLDEGNLPPADQRRLRDAFRKEGVQDADGWRWVAMKDPESFVASTGVSLADMDSQSVSDLFASRAHQMVVERIDDTYYALLGDNPELAMTPEQDWKIESAKRSVDQAGQPAVALHLDAAGGDILKRLTTANVRRNMAVVINGEILMAPRIAEAMGQGVVITSGGDGFSQSEIDGMVRAFEPKPLQVVINGPPVSVMSFGVELRLRQPPEGYVLPKAPQD